MVIYDKLVGSAVLDLVRRDARADLCRQEHGRPQQDPGRDQRLIAEQAQAGRRVVRLKGGDPFIFGRGGEELEYLRRRGIPVEVVPGITAALGCAAAAGIPLTHRDHAQAVTFATGQGKDGEPELDWATLAKLKQTLVDLHGRRRRRTDRRAADRATASIPRRPSPSSRTARCRASGRSTAASPASAWLVRQSGISRPGADRHRRGGGAGRRGDAAARAACDAAVA